jgi:hypothetical protein
MGLYSGKGHSVRAEAKALRIRYHLSTTLTVQNKIVHKVEAVTDNDKGKLICQKLHLLQEVLDLVVDVVVSLCRFPGPCKFDQCRHILKLHLGILTEHNDEARVVVETCS